MRFNNSISKLSKQQKAWLVIIVSLPITIAYSNLAYKRFILKESPKKPLSKDPSELKSQIEEHLDLLRQEQQESDAQKNDHKSQLITGNTAHTNNINILNLF
ncbi:hypothetical protein BB561_001255 [Smittium simulii]|uniref:Uncharacterized protein n=1 Tax=Smittium simulii TaxID=133385 RepID=A0A2T9YVF4_9FUNG|nr:hypothetical protein BB561_001255 [Smittium simulii]